MLKTQVNKTKVQTAKEKQINNNHWSRNKTCFKKKNFHDEKRGTIFSCEIFSL